MTSCPIGPHCTPHRTPLSHPTPCFTTFFHLVGPRPRSLWDPTLAPHTPHPTLAPHGTPPSHHAGPHPRTLDVAPWGPSPPHPGRRPVGPHPRTSWDPTRAPLRASPCATPRTLASRGNPPSCGRRRDDVAPRDPPSQLVIPQPTPQNSPAHTPGPLPAHPAMNPTLAACWHPVGPHTCTPTPSKLSAHHPCRSHSNSPPCSLPSLTTLVRLVLVPPLGASMCRTALAAGHTTAMLAAAISRLAPDDVGSLPTSSPDVVSLAALV